MADPILAKPDFNGVIQVTISTASAKLPQPKEVSITIPAH